MDTITSQRFATDADPLALSGRTPPRLNAGVGQTTLPVWWPLSSRPATARGEKGSGSVRGGRPACEPAPIEAAKACLERVAALEFVAPAGAGERSLEVGGWHTVAPCAERGFEAHAAVSSPVLAHDWRTELARHGFGPERVLEFNRPHFPFVDGGLALITCLGGLLDRAAERGAMLREFARLLRPGGTLIASVWASGSFSASLPTGGAGFLTPRSPDLAALFSDLADVGLQCERHTYAVCLSTGNLGVMLGGGRIATRLARLTSLDREMRQLFPGMKGQVFVLLARKVTR